MTAKKSARGAGGGRSNTVTKAAGSRFQNTIIGGGSGVDNNVLVKIEVMFQRYDDLRRDIDSLRQHSTASKSEPTAWIFGLFLFYAGAIGTGYFYLDSKISNVLDKLFVQQPAVSAPVTTEAAQPQPAPSQ